MKKIELSNKIKKRILVGVVCFVVVLIVALSIPKTVYDKIFTNRDLLIEDNLNEEGLSKLIYILNKDDNLVGVNIKIDVEEDDEIVQKWDLLTSKANTYPLGYSTPIAPSTKLNKYEILQNKLTLVLSEEFYNSDGKNALASIAWTFCNDSIDEVIIKIDEKIVTELQNYQFNKIDKSINVNYIFETSYLFEAEYITILHNEGEFLKPVTYFYKDVSSVDFIVSKLFDQEIYENKAYTYEINENELMLNLGVDEVLSTDVIDVFRETIKLNFDLNSLTISNNVMTIYEEDFTINSSINSSLNQKENNELTQG